MQLEEREDYGSALKGNLNHEVSHPRDCRRRACNILAVDPGPIFSSDASANRMNGKGPWCAEGMNCMSARATAASAKSRKAPMH